VLPKNREPRPGSACSPETLEPTCLESDTRAGAPADPRLMEGISFVASMTSHAPLSRPVCLRCPPRPRRPIERTLRAGGPLHCILYITVAAAQLLRLEESESNSRREAGPEGGAVDERRATPTSRAHCSYRGLEVRAPGSACRWWFGSQAPCAPRSVLRGRSARARERGGGPRRRGRAPPRCATTDRPVWRCSRPDPAS